MPMATKLDREMTSRWGGGTKRPPTSFSPVTSTIVRNSPPPKISDF